MIAAWRARRGAAPAPLSAARHWPAIGVEQLLLLSPCARSRGHVVQVDEHRDLGWQDHRVDRLEHIVDRAHRIAADQVLSSLLTADRKTIGIRWSARARG